MERRGEDQLDELNIFMMSIKNNKLTWRHGEHGDTWRYMEKN